MAAEEVIAVFKADIEQFKAQMAELGIKIADVEKKTEAAGGTTQKFTGHTKTAAASVTTLSKGLGGIAGLLGITGRLFGVNTDKVEALVFASREFVKVGREIAHVQHLSNAATEASTVAKTAAEKATTSLTVAQKLLNAVTSGAVGIVLAIGAALTAGIAILIGYNKAQETRKQVQEDLNKLEKEGLATFLESQRAQREAAKKSFENALQQKVNNKEITEFEKDRAELGRQFRIDTKLNEITRDQELINLEKRRKRDKLSEETLTAEKLLIQNKFIDNSKSIDATFRAKSESLTIAENQADKQAFLDFKQDALDANVDFNDKNIEADNKKRLEEKEATKKANSDALKELREFQKERNDVNIEAADNNLIRIRTEGEAARKELEDQKKKDDADTLKEAKAFFDFHDKEDKRLLEEQKKREQERIDTAKQVLDTIFKAQQEAFDKNKELEDKQISDQEKNIDIQRDLAARGLDNTLAFEQKRAAELQRQQQKEAQAQKRVKLLETFLNSLAEFSKKDPKTALSKALLQVALATAATAVFAEDGGIIGEIGERSNLSRKHRGGGDVLLHAQKGEGIFSRDEMSNLGRRNFHLLKDAARFPIRDDVFGLPKIAMSGGLGVSNSELIKEVKGLRNDIRNQKRESWEVNKFGEYIKTSIENGVTEVTKGKMPKPRFRA